VVEEKVPVIALIPPPAAESRYRHVVHPVCATHFPLARQYPELQVRAKAAAVELVCTQVATPVPQEIQARPVELFTYPVLHALHVVAVS